MPKVGAHVSAAVSLDLSFDRAKKIGAETTQIFISPPQQWVQIPHKPEEVGLYRSKAETSGIGPNFIHGIYLINLASDNPEFVQKAIDWLIYSQKMAEVLGAEGTIFHLGSAKKLGREQALKQVAQSLVRILEKSGPSNLILENSAGAGELIGDQLFELGQIIKTVSDPRIKICLDTQHAFASGYDLRDKEGIEKLIWEFKQEIGLDKLVVIHANDSKTELSSHRDRHENIGEGFIGLEGFKNIINHPAFKNIPFILEVPGFTGTGPDQENITRLRGLLKLAH